MVNTSDQSLDTLFGPPSLSLTRRIWWNPQSSGGPWEQFGHSPDQATEEGGMGANFGRLSRTHQ